MAVHVYDYGDYHEYLKEWVEEQKSLRPTFSYQFLANRAGLKSRSFLRLVCMGEKDLSATAAVSLSQAIGHDKKEAEFFETLVAFNNAKNIEEKNHFLSKLSRIAKPNRKVMLSVQQYDLFNKWFIIPVWELVTIDNFGEDWRRLARRLNPPITAPEAKYAVELLLELGLLEKREGAYFQRESVLHTQEEVYSVAVQTYQAGTMQLGQEALQRHRKDVRHISTLTLGVNKEGYDAIRDKIQEFRTELVDLASKFKPTDRVYQCNIQFFPLTQIGGGEGA